jgi:predicted aspartyl protease
VGGVRTGRITTAGSVEAGGVRAQHVGIVIMDGLPMPLLGMSFLSRFDMLLDRGDVELRDGVIRRLKTT